MLEVNYLPLFTDSMKIITICVIDIPSILALHCTLTKFKQSMFLTFCSFQQSWKELTSLALSRSQALAELAFVIVSWVVNV